MGRESVIGRFGEREAESMRDIRQDLRERLAGITARYYEELYEYDLKREALEERRRTIIEALDQERVAVEQLLKVEEERHGASPSEVEARKTARLIPLATFIETKVHAHGPMDKDQLRAEAHLAGYFLDGNGRSFHATLMNIAKSGRVVQLSDGRYAFPERAAVSLDEDDSEEAECRAWP
jgi:hypothetical protein